MKQIKLLVLIAVFVIGAANVSAQTKIAAVADEITSVAGPAQVAQGENVTISVAYEASIARKIESTLQLNAPPWSVHAFASANVDAGVGTIQLAFTVPVDTPAGSNYQYQTLIAPLGGGWNNRLDNMSYGPVEVTATPGETDQIISVVGSDSVNQGETATVSVDYESTTDRDIVFAFQLNESPWTSHYSETKTISAGVATTAFTFMLPSDVPAGNNYQYQVFIAPLNGSWDSRLHNMNQSPIEVTDNPIPPTVNIRLNQEGYFTNGEKIISVKTEIAGVFHLKSPDFSTTYFSGSFSAPDYWQYSDENIATIDISSFKTIGEYVIEIPGIGYSHVFKINNQVALESLTKSLKAYYYMRASSPVLAEYGGQWARNAGHLDTNVVVNESAASTNRPTGTIISSPKGWYDAGDYNKYIINSGISTYTLLAAYEQFPDLFDTLNTNIPESSNSTPDILDEIKWNLDWMLTMQDPDDGGVYFKLTNENFDATVMPENGQSTPRYVIQKTTSSALNFAAVMATAARVFSQFDATYASQCLTAAQAAWNWANVNPDIIYNQNSHNNLYDPNIYTGAYQDNKISDEFIWAAAELYITTADDNYYTSIDWTKAPFWFVPNWSHVDFLAIYSLLLHQDSLSTIVLDDIPFMQARLLNRANAIRTHYESQSAHRVTMGYFNNDFTWGSNGVASNQGMLLAKAFYLTGDITYLDAAISSFDYILGRNATSYSFVTGVGDKTPVFPHHRPSQADTVTEPIPGMVVGGPQNGLNPDSCVYPAQQPANKYVDNYCSYSTNEITINWNAPFVFLSAALQRHFGDLIFKNSFE